MRRAHWFFLVAVAAALAFLFARRRPAPTYLSPTPDFELQDEAAPARRLPPDAEREQVSGTDSIQAQKVESKKEVVVPLPRRKTP